MVRWASALFRQACKARRVRLGSFGKPENRIVAGYLAFEAETLFYPDERWIYGEEDKSQLLDQVNPIVRPTKVLHLMKNDLSKLGWSELFEEPLWNENPRREEADHAWAVDLR